MVNFKKVIIFTKERYNLFIVVILVLFSLFSSSTLYANSNLENKYKPYFEMGGIKYFNQHSNAAGVYDLFIPLLQSYDQLFFTDLRIFDRSGNSFEGNAHIGYRRLLPNIEQMIGIYGAFDRKKSIYGNWFNQITLGIEYWNNNLFIGGNTYKPIGQTRKYISDFSVADIQKDIDLLNIKKRTKTAIYQGAERPMGGFDAEIGYAFTGRLTGYVGGYYFADDNVDTIVGPKVRITYNYMKPVGRILGVFDGISIEAGGQHDKPRGTSGYIGIKLKLGLTNLTKETSNNLGFERHMTELIRRDQDIVVQKIKTPQVIQIISKEAHLEKQDFIDYFEINKKTIEESQKIVLGINELLTDSTDEALANRALAIYASWLGEYFITKLSGKDFALLGPQDLKKANRQIEILFHPDKYKQKYENKNIKLFNEVYIWSNEKTKKEVTVEESQKIALEIHELLTGSPDEALDKYKQKYENKNIELSGEICILSNKTPEEVHAGIYVNYPDPNAFYATAKLDVLALPYENRSIEISQQPSYNVTKKEVFLKLLNNDSALNITEVANNTGTKKLVEDSWLSHVLDKGKWWLLTSSAYFLSKEGSNFLLKKWLNMMLVGVHTYTYIQKVLPSTLGAACKSLIKEFLSKRNYTSVLWSAGSSAINKILSTYLIMRNLPPTDTGGFGEYLKELDSKLDTHIKTYGASAAISKGITGYKVSEILGASVYYMANGFCITTLLAPGAWWGSLCFCHLWADAIADAYKYIIQDDIDKHDERKNRVSQLLLLLEKENNSDVIKKIQEKIEETKREIRHEDL